VPLKHGKSRKAVSENIRELHKGKTYAHTRSAFGADRANAQAVAIALKKAGRSRRKK